MGKLASRFVAVGLLGLFSFGLAAWVLVSRSSVCVVGTITESLQHTIAVLDGIVDLDLKLSTTLVGLGAAVLIGLKDGVKLTPVLRLILFVSTLLFAQAALYAVLWRLGIANSWFNTCLNLVSELGLQRLYQAHLACLLAGLTSLGVLVIAAALNGADEAA